MSAQGLRFVADLIEAERIPWPPTDEQVRAAGITRSYEECGLLVEQAGALNVSRAAAAWMFRQLSNERAKAEPTAAAIQPVVSGPCLVSGMRGTEDAFREIIDHAQHSILITGFVLHNGPSVLRRLAARLDSDSKLDALLCLDVSRLPGDTTDSQAIIAAFVTRFRQDEWPGLRMPRLYYDPRSLSRGSSEHSVLHAKIAIADSSRALIGSANLTEAALKRNIELGVLVQLPAIVARIRDHLQMLIHNNVLVQAPL